MRKIVFEFIRRGFSACGIGPIVLAILYLILQQQGAIQILTVNQVCKGIVSISVLAFLAGGMNVIYQVERMPLMVAILIHGCVLYGGYLGTYLLNGWLEWRTTSILVFTSIFGLGYLVIWGIIYFLIKKRTNRINEILKQKRKEM